MADFKVNDGFNLCVNALKNAGDNINTNITSVDNISTMSVAEKFYRQQVLLEAVLTMYAKLIAKEAEDLSKMVEEAKALDEKLVLIIKK